MACFGNRAAVTPLVPISSNFDSLALPLRPSKLGRLFPVKKFSPSVAFASGAVFAKNQLNEHKMDFYSTAVKVGK